MKLSSKLPVAKSQIGRDVSFDTGLLVREYGVHCEMYRIRDVTTIKVLDKGITAAYAGTSGIPEN
jgi:hypothetical protein